jgi:hypothetical protein
MSDLYLVFNNTLVDLLTALKNSFASNDNISAAEIIATHRFTLFRKTKELFEMYSPHVSSDILTAINARDADALYKNNEDNKFIKDIGGRQVFDNLKANEEQSILWNSLQSLSKHFAIILATGDSLTVFENIAKSFVEKNKGMNPSQYQSALFSQLFTDKDLSRQLLGAFENPESISKIIGNLSPILSSLAPAQTDAEPDDEDEDNEDEDEGDGQDDNTDTDNDEDDSKKDVKAGDSDDEDEKDRRPSRIFAKIKRRRGRNNKKKKKKKKKKANPFADLAEMMSGVELKEDELKQLHQGVRSTLSGESSTIAGSGGLDISSMMASLASGDSGALSSMLRKAQESDGTTDNSESNALLAQISPMLATMSAVMGGGGSDSKMTSNDAVEAIKKLAETANVAVNLPADEKKKMAQIEEELDVPDFLPDLIDSDGEVYAASPTTPATATAAMIPLPQTDDEGDDTEEENDHKYIDECCLASSVLLPADEKTN